MIKRLAALSSLVLAVTSLGVAASAQAAVPAPKAHVILQPPKKVLYQRTADGKLHQLSVLALTTNVYHYQGAREQIATGLGAGTATQVAALASTHKPYVHITNVYSHSLWEVVLETLDGANTAEFGWNVDPALYPDSNPHLFSYSIVNGAGQKYNADNPNWIDNPGESVNAGTSLAYTAGGAVPTVFNQFRIERTPATQPSWQTGGPGWQFVWKASGTDHVIGYLPDTQWTSQSASLTGDYIQMFGEEIETDNDNTCNDGGSGVYGTSTDPSAAARMTAYSFAGAPGYTNVPDSVFVLPAGDTPNAYRVYQKPTDLDYVKYGGTGYNAAGTGAGSVGSC